MLLYELPGYRLNDSWYIKENGVYHAYFLEYSNDRPLDGSQYNKQNVGHMTSSDMRNWKYEGTILTPKENFWLDKGIATGSVVKLNGKFYMLVTGNSYNCAGGFALAVSDDLYNWEFVGDKPVIDRTEPFSFQYNNKQLKAMLLADPYIYPEPDADGYFTAFINSRICDFPANCTAAIVTLKSKDLINWIPSKVACFAPFDRIETPAVWEKDGKWYMYAGEAYYILDENFNNLSQRNFNSFYVSNTMEGPYFHLNRLVLPDGEYGYIGKTLIDTDGEEIFTMNNPPVGAVGPYHMEYVFKRDVPIEIKLTEKK